jgi:hypothetical protein
MHYIDFEQKQKILVHPILAKEFEICHYHHKRNMFLYSYYFKGTKFDINLANSDFKFYWCHQFTDESK